LFSLKFLLVLPTGVYEGQEVVDFIGLFSKMAMVHILARIWGYLTIEDLGRVQQVTVSRISILTRARSGLKNRAQALHCGLGLLRAWRLM
jgi:hypothetical protein